jgi:hypothetical protein
MNLRAYLPGWEAYFRLVELPSVFRDLDSWIRHRLRALQLKHWKRGPTIFRELRARGMSPRDARRVAGNASRWWHSSRMLINIALPTKLFDQLGLPSTLRTAGCGPACPVVWQGRRGNPAPLCRYVFYVDTPGR